MEGDPRAVYQDRIQRFRDERTEVGERIGRTRRSRLVLFFLLVVFFLVGEWTAGLLARSFFVAGVLATVGFVFLVVRHRRLRDEEARLEVRVDLNEEALARCERRWEGLPAALPAPDTGDHPYADDLDMVGPTSVERLLSTVSTGPGARTLRSWLLAPASSGEIRARQEAVEELSHRIEFRQELAARARVAGLGRTDLTESFLAWAEEESWLDPRRPLLWTARAVPVLTLLLFLFQVAGWLDGYWWLLGPLVGLFFLGIWTEPIGEVIDRISAGQRFIGAYGDPLELLEELEPGSERMGRVRDLARSGEGSASRALRSLERWITTADVRYNHLIHVPLQVTLFWDVHVLRALEKWRDRNGASVASWLQAVGEAEALAALAALRADNPEWCFPDLAESGAGGDSEAGTPGDSDSRLRSRMPEVRVRARGLGHPLIPPERSVVNDAEVGPPGTFLLVTGSNMSGKSTLLRSIGANCVLGLAGGPVCAAEFRLPRVRVLTSMRTEDSLARG
ncbi:MAG: hypothetical protein R3223_06675, partial [Longimicrobiales bacterium]|nr:hypothetical protein [Longimicrobiales bacterium]